MFFCYMAETPDDLIPVSDAARILGVSPETVRRWERMGRLNSIRTLGGQRRYRRGDLTEHLAPRANSDEVSA